MNDLFKEPEDGTLLSEEEKEGLIPAYISTRPELNRAEQDNILQAQIWAHKRTRNPLSIKFLRSLHERMFGEVWEWAGSFRTTERNIGVDPVQIQVQLQTLIDDASYWVQNNTYEPVELGARFHHRLVYIHPFPNGNGRHARLATDILMRYMGHDPFSWGQASLDEAGEIRRAYIDALRAANQQDYDPLISFLNDGD